jgi:ATP-binding cassette subfamily B protein
VHELTRVGLLSSLPGETLGKIAARMEREEVPPGRQVVREGDQGERFYVVLSGLFAVSQEDLGPRRVLRPGDYFGEVALAMDVPRTASVRALTPSVVASCDRETFDQLLRPLFADDR